MRDHGPGFHLTNELPNTWMGMKVIESTWLTEAGEPIAIRRTWRERLLSRPWTPWRATKMITPQIPSKQVIQLNSDTLVMHPAQRLAAELKERGVL